MRDKALCKKIKRVKKKIRKRKEKERVEMDRIQEKRTGDADLLCDSSFVLAFGEAVSRRGRRSLCYFTGDASGIGME
ncbi:hypothetical protein [Suipraeoptans intestinalis]|uniref:hypothetical protein n=1 Tax=Suipraeoptans intestinalis TaxID=2606628 RepID=UPI002ED52901